MDCLLTVYKVLKMAPELVFEGQHQLLFIANRDFIVLHLEDDIILPRASKHGLAILEPPQYINGSRQSVVISG